MDDIRFYKNLKNQVNRTINKERYIRKTTSFQEEGLTPKTIWQNLKMETGQSKHTSPKMIIEGIFFFYKAPGNGGFIE